MGSADRTPLALLERCAAIARDLGSGTVEAEAREASARLAEQRFFLACLGQFKRGKSSLLNALVGRSVLPVGVPPVTSALTVLRHGPVARAEVSFADGGRRAIALGELGAFVDERENPENVKDVAAVEVFLPAALLETGLCLVDTPGLGSVFTGNTAVTRAFVPQIDAALVVLGCDPPITGEEAELLAEVAAEEPHVVIVLNKADRAAPTELQEARRFTRTVIEGRLGRPVEALLEVSARERLETGLPTREWAALEQALFGLARRSRAEILEASAGRAVRRHREALLAEVAEREAALRRPLQDTEARVARLREAATGAQQLLTDLGALLAATEADLARRYEAVRSAFVARAAKEAGAELDEALGRGVADGRPRDRALHEARGIAERRIREFLAEAEPLGEHLYSHATERFVGAANALLSDLSGQEAAPLPRIEPCDGFQKRRGFFFASMMSRTYVGFWAGLADRAGFRRAARAGRHASAYLRELLFANSMRVVGDLRDRVLESRRSLEHEVRRRLTEASSAADRALAAAQRSHAAGAAAVAAELGRLGHLRMELDRMGRAEE
jgi:GTP-binding protein EngB required for normal cell division